MIVLAHNRTEVQIPQQEKENLFAIRRQCLHELDHFTGGHIIEQRRRKYVDGEIGGATAQQIISSDGKVVRYLYQPFRVGQVTAFFIIGNCTGGDKKELCQIPLGKTTILTELRQNFSELRHLTPQNFRLNLLYNF